MVKLAIEFENPAKLWWESGGRELWDSIAYGFDGNEVLVDDDVAHSWIARAANIPGWEGGPNYAPHPVFVKSVDQDEEL